MNLVNRIGDTVEFWVIDGTGWKHLKLKPYKEGKVEGMGPSDVKANMLISIHFNEGSTMIEISDRKIDSVTTFGSCIVKKSKDKDTGELIISIERKA